MPSLDPFDALLLVSFGGPEGPDDVVPFLENVTRGRGIPRERLAEVGEHYFLFGGVSPINGQCRALVAALECELSARGDEIPVYWGNRNWDPYLGATIDKMERDGVRRAVAVTTSAYSSYSSCRQYRENLFDAASDHAVEIAQIRRYFHHPGFVEAFVDETVRSLDGWPADTHLAFVTHSIPDAMNEASGAPGSFAYERQHLDVAGSVTRIVTERTGHEHPWSLSYCSRSGPPSVPWLEPDINDRLSELAQSGVSHVAVIPIGFVSDHMEVIFDLDTEAAQTAAELGLNMIRVSTPGTHQAFVAGLVDLVEERAAIERGEDPVRPVVGGLLPYGEICADGCCAGTGEPRSALGDPIIR